MQVVREKQSYRLPVAKIADIPSFRALDICRCHIFQSGIIYIAVSDTMLKTVEEMYQAKICKHLPVEGVSNQQFQPRVRSTLALRIRYPGLLSRTAKEYCDEDPEGVEDGVQNVQSLEHPIERILFLRAEHPQHKKQD